MVKVFILAAIASLMFSCQSNSVTKKADVVSRINDVVINPYDSTVLLLDLTLENFRDTNILIKKKEIYPATIDSQWSSFSNAVVVLNQHDLVTKYPEKEIQDHFPEILFTDSAYKLKQFSEDFLQSEKHKEIWVDGVAAYVLPAKKTLNIKMQIILDPYEFSKLKKNYNS